ncbi:MAG: TonB-dependent receptor family protein [Flavobacteriaceae bacterium]|jgi:hypothetical protein|nr:TonB-dependent receptor family protein [Flavobacteriaceae bacterium]
MKHFTLLIFLFLTSLSFAQSTVNVRGMVIDSLGKPIEASTVYFSKQRDSTLVEYTMTDSKGNFKMSFNKVKDPLVLKISMIGYKEYIKKFDKGVEGDIEIGNVTLKEYGQLLDELVVQAEVPPIRIKKDTLEFNAASFKVRPDANLEELLKQLPGVQIDENKAITINGKPVNEILVNGKPFFSEDGKIALENLPAEIIKKVQITDKKSKKEKFTKERSRNDDASINITVDEEKNKGYFGRVSAGYGSDKRYESGLFLNSFNQKRKVSVVGSANNINATGFSMDKVFDNMRSGKSGGGITESRMLGVNFIENVSDKLNVNGSYNYNFSESENKGKRSATNFLPSGTFSTNSESNAITGSEGHRANASVDYTGDKDAFFFSPTFNKSHNYSNSEGAQLSLDENGKPLNESTSSSSSKGDSSGFGSSARYLRKFKKEGQFFTIDFSNSNNLSTQDILHESLTQFHQSDKPDDQRRQFKKSAKTNDSYGISMEYSQPITDSLVLAIGTRWYRDQTIDDLKVYNFNEGTGEYTDLNVLETNRYTTVSTDVSPYVNISVNKKKYFININTQTSIVKNSSKALFNGKDYAIDKNYINPNVNAMINYNFSKDKTLFGYYRYNVTYQSANELLDITDISNPLNTTIGNPDLKPTGQHSVNLSYRSYNFQSRMGYSISANTSMYDNSIVNSVIYDADKKAISTYQNINGNYQWSVNGDWYINSKWGDHALKYGVSLRFNQTVNNGFIDGAQYQSVGDNIVPRAYLNYDYKELLNIKPSYSYRHNTTKYTNFSVDKASNFVHRFNIQTTSYWPKNVVFGNDFGYTYNSQIAAGYKRDFYMWNISLAYEFYKSKFNAKVKIYDLLNQNTSSVRTIDPMQIVDSESLVLKRYIMFSLTYKLNEFAGAKKGGGRGRGGMSSPMRAVMH